MFAFLKRNKIYFQKHYKKIPGNPDIAIPSKKKVVFIDGDFWHGWKIRETKKRLPSNYWKEKIETNIKRDIKNRRRLKRTGWKILRIWEHELESNLQKNLKRIMTFLE